MVAPPWGDPSLANTGQTSCQSRCRSPLGTASQDFCYYANAILVSYLLFFPSNDRLFLLCFAFAEVCVTARLCSWEPCIVCATRRVASPECETKNASARTEHAWFTLSSRFPIYCAGTRGCHCDVIQAMTLAPSLHSSFPSLLPCLVLSSLRVPWRGPFSCGAAALCSAPWIRL